MALTAFAIGVSPTATAFSSPRGLVAVSEPRHYRPRTPTRRWLFGYLFAIAAGTLAVILHKKAGWWPLGWGVLGHRSVDRAWMAADVKPAWVMPVPRRGRRPVRWTTWRRLGESRDPLSDVVELSGRRWSGPEILLGVVIFFATAASRRGWLALGCNCIGLYRSVADARSVCRGPGAVPVRWTTRGRVVRQWRAWRSDNLASPGWSSSMAASTPIGVLRADVERGATGFWARCPSRRPSLIFLVRWWCCAAARPASAVGLHHIGPLAAPFLVAAESAGALARAAYLWHRGAASSRRA